MNRTVLYGAVAAVAVAAAVAAVLFLLPANSIRDGVFTQEQAVRGEALYLRSCSGGICHRPTLLGDGFETPMLAGSEFVRKWDGRTLAELYNTGHTEPGTPCGPATPGCHARVQSIQDNVDIIAYILRYNGYPTGRSELPPDLERLGAITVDRR